MTAVRLEAPLTDGVVALRPWTEADLPALHRGFADPLVQRFSWPRLEPYGEADARAFLGSQDAAWRSGEEASLAVVEGGAVVGGAALYAIDRELSSAAVGYWLAPRGRGRGLATRAVALLARWAFRDLGLARLELTCGPDNAASQRVAERCGFTREGLLRSHVPFKGGRRDSVIFGLLPHELDAG